MMTNLPQELAAQLMTFLRETTEDDYEVIDMGGLVNFVVAHGAEYPFLYGLVKVNEAAVAEQFEKTGEVPPGIKMVRKTQESDNVTRLEVLHGPIPPRSE